MSDADKLLPCPSCGSAELFTDTSYTGFVVSCDDCSMRGSLADWNTRAAVIEADRAQCLAAKDVQIAAMQAHADALAGMCGEAIAIADSTGATLKGRVSPSDWARESAAAIGIRMVMLFPKVRATLRAYEAFKAGEPT